MYIGVIFLKMAHFEMFLVWAVTISNTITAMNYLSNSTISESEDDPYVKSSQLDELANLLREEFRRQRPDKFLEVVECCEQWMEKYLPAKIDRLLRKEQFVDLHKMR